MIYSYMSAEPLFAWINSLAYLLINLSNVIIYNYFLLYSDVAHILIVISLLFE